MAKTYAEFMAVGDVKTMPSGEETLKVQKTLQKAFRASKQADKADQEKVFAMALETIMKTKIGHETMTELSKLGYKFTFEVGDVGGFCDSEKKRIALNPCDGFNYMLSTAVHEGQHALQAAREKKPVMLEELQVASMLKKHRAIEADATAHEVAFLYELKETNPEPYEEEKERGLPMLPAYEAEMNKSGDGRKALEAAFKAWYDCEPLRNFYDDWHTPWVEKVADQGIEYEEPGYFSVPLKSKDILDCCLYQGKPYVDPAFLETDKAFSIGKQDRENIMEWTRDYANEVEGAKRDRSITKMAVRNEKGEIISSPKTAAAKNARKER